MKNSYTELHENPPGGLVADNKSKTDGQTWSPHKVLFVYFVRNAQKLTSVQPKRSQDFLVLTWEKANVRKFPFIQYWAYYNCKNNGNEFTGHKIYVILLLVFLLNCFPPCTF